MKKVAQKISLLLMSLMLLSVGQVVKAEESEGDLSVIYIKDMSKSSLEAEKQMQESVRNRTNVETSINLKDVEINNSGLNIEGNFNIDNEKISFELNGELKRIDTSDNIIVGDLKDLKNNFEVIHFSIDKGSEKMVPAFEDTYNNESSFNLYLRKLNSNDIVFLQTDIPSGIDTDNLFNNIDNLHMFKAEDLSWYTKVTEPIDFISQNIPVEKGTFDTQTVQRHYTIKYEWMGKQFGELIWINCSVNAGNLGYSGSVIEKYHGYTFNYSTSSITTYSTTSKIRDVDIKTGVTTGTLTYVTTGGTHSQGSSGIKATIGVSASTPIPGVDISFGFSTVQTVVGTSNWLNKPTARIQIESGKYLLGNKEHFDVIANYANDNGGNAATTFSYRIECGADSSNRWDTVSVYNDIY